MEANLWKKNQSEVSTDELLAYTLAKLRPFEWVKITMYVKNDLDMHPPIFCWRFNGQNDEIYKELRECINKYEGSLKWVLYKGSDIGGHTKTNYTIEPIIFYEIHKTQGFGNLKEALGDQYEETCLTAIEDIPMLCKHIESYFNITQMKPYSPVLPFHKS